MGILARLKRTDAAGTTRATPGEVPVLVPVQPNVPPVMMRAPYDPAGMGSFHGRDSGASIARQMGAPTPGVETVTQRYDPYSAAIRDAIPFDNANANRNRTASHHQGRHFVTYHIDARRQWGIAPFFNGHHGRYRRAGFGMTLGHPSGGLTPGGGANPVVAREKPGAWDTGIVRGLPS